MSHQLRQNSISFQRVRKQAEEQALPCVKRNETVTSIQMRHLTRFPGFKFVQIGNVCGSVCAHAHAHRHTHACLCVCRCTLAWNLPRRLGWLAVSAGNAPVYTSPVPGLQITGMHHCTRLFFSFLMLIWGIELRA